MAQLRYEKKRATVLGSQMAYIEVGQGDPIVFLHGNPTSSYMWRNIIPHCEHLGRLIAPDLMGMGDSDKFADSGPHRYGLSEQYQYIDALLETLQVRERVTLVVHSWGAVLGDHWANLHRGAMKGLVTIDSPHETFPSWAGMPEQMRVGFQKLLSEEGEQMVLQNNFFIEMVIPNKCLRKLSEEEMNEYRRPFLEPGESRRAMLSLARSIPVEGKPEDVCRMIRSGAEFFKSSVIPKLSVVAEPGSLSHEARAFISSWSNVTELVVMGGFICQEDSPDEIGKAIAEWYPSIGDATAVRWVRSKV